MTDNLYIPIIEFFEYWKSENQTIKRGIISAEIDRNQPNFPGDKSVQIDIERFISEKIDLSSENFPSAEKQWSCSFNLNKAAKTHYARFGVIPFAPTLPLFGKTAKTRRLLREIITGQWARLGNKTGISFRFPDAYLCCHLRFILDFFYVLDFFCSLDDFWSNLSVFCENSVDFHFEIEFDCVFRWFD